MIKHPKTLQASGLITPALACLALTVSTSQGALVSAFGLEESSGTTVSQSVVGGAPDGTINLGTGTATWVPGIAPGSSQALALTGNARVEIGTSTVWNGVDGFSVSAWIQPTAFAGSGHSADSIFWMGLSSGSGRMVLQMNDLADVRTGGRRDGATTTGSFNTDLTTGTNITGTSNGSAGDPLVLNDIYHLAATADYTTGLLSLYIDGALISSRTITGWGTGSSSPTESVVMRLGSNASGGENYTGTIDDVRIFNTALSASEVAALAAPEPSVALLGALGLFGWMGGRRRQHA